MFRTALLSSVLFTALAGAGCGSPYGYRGYGYLGPPPPPPRYMGPMGYAPGPGFVWIDGFYEPRGSRWVWVPGYWVRPPRPRAVWVRPHYAPHGRSYRYYRGHWRH